VDFDNIEIRNDRYIGLFESDGGDDGSSDGNGDDANDSDATNEQAIIGNPVNLRIVGINTNSNGEEKR
jgi:hypothetical protein